MKYSFLVINFVLSLFLLVYLVLTWSCHADNNVQRKNSHEYKSQVDSVQLKLTAIAYAEGKQLFSRLCNACHNAPEKNVLDQYLFVELFERLPAPGEAYFVKFISDSKDLKASGDEYARQLDEAWSQDYEHMFKDSMSSNDFTNLIRYIRIADRQRFTKKY